MKTTKSNSIKEISKISEILNQVQDLKSRGYTNIWWFTDLDGMLVSITLFNFIEREETKRVFDEVSNILPCVIGLTSNGKEWAVKTGEDLKKKNIEFYFSKERKNKLIALDSFSLNILYNGIIYAGAPKGFALVDYFNFIKSFGQQLPNTIIFSDDKEKNVKSVLDVMAQKFPEINTIGFYYKFEEI